MALATSLAQAIELIFSWPAIGWLIGGTLLGIILGIIPGLGAVLGMAMVIPLTFALDGPNAIIVLISLYLGSVYGGSIPAILINTPGTAAAVATTLDGYPMARMGRGKDALVTSAMSSSLGGIISTTTVILLSPLLISLVLLFGSPEYFLFALFGIVLITLVSRGSMVKGLTIGAFGLILSTVGFPISAGSPRYTFGLLSLYNGLSFVAILIGVFAIGEMINLANERGEIAQTDIEIEGGLLGGILNVVRNPITVIKSTFIGMTIGAIPGAGSVISNFVSYMEAVRSDPNPDAYGQGEPKGVIGAETANNATVAGSLIPTLAFGVPGSGATAILLAGLLAHGIDPGLNLFQEQLYLTHSLFLSLIVGSFIIMIVGLFFVSKLFIFTKIDTDYIIPMVLPIVVIGTLSLRNNWIDVITVILFGFAGYYMREYEFPMIAFVLGVILGPIAEENLIRSLQLSGGSLSIFWSEPLRLLLSLLIIFVLFTPLWGHLRKRLETE